MDGNVVTSRAGLAFPDPPPAPAGRYLRGVRAGELLFLSGHFPVRAGTMVYTGRVGAELSIAEGRAAAELTAMNVLAQIERLLGGLAPLRGLVRVEGHVASAPDFVRQAAVLDGASELFMRVLGDRGGHARTAFAHAVLPMNAAAELVVTASIDPRAEVRDA